MLKSLQLNYGYQLQHANISIMGNMIKDEFINGFTVFII